LPTPSGDDKNASISDSFSSVVNLRLGGGRSRDAADASVLPESARVERVATELVEAPGVLLLLTLLPLLISVVVAALGTEMEVVEEDCGWCRFLTWFARR
jgi:hypothetical protein